MRPFRKNNVSCGQTRISWKSAAYLLILSVILVFLCIVGFVESRFRYRSIFVACSAGDVADVKRHIRWSLGGKINSHDKQCSGFTPLHWAAEYGRVEVVDLLLRSGADINATENHGETPLQIAVRGDQFQVIKLLIERGADTNVPGQSEPLVYYLALSSAVSPETESLLAEACGLVGEGTRSGDTYLHYACRSPHLDVLNDALRKVPDVNVADASGDTPLHYAVRARHGKAVQLLLDAGANVNARNTNGDTPLHVALRRPAEVDLVKTLLAAGADVDAVNLSGKTPLGVLIGGKVPSSPNWRGPVIDSIRNLLKEHGAEDNGEDVEWLSLK